MIHLMMSNTTVNLFKLMEQNHDNSSWDYSSIAPVLNLAKEKTKETILIIIEEDKEQDRMKSLLAADGYHVIATSNSFEALMKLYQTKVDLILIDEMMPELNGIDAASEIKSDEETKNIPITILSHNTDRLNAIDNIQSICDHILAKNDDSNELLLDIEAILEN